MPQSEDDKYKEVERGIDWLERLEIIKARQDREAAMRETVEYVDRLRAALAALCEDTATELISERHGDEVADLIENIREGNSKDPWLEYLRPALMEH